jgi:hypothetical protein
MQPTSLEASTVLATTSRNGAAWLTTRSSRGLLPRRRRSQAMLHSYRRATSTAALIRPLASSSARGTSLGHSHNSDNTLCLPVCAPCVCLCANLLFRPWCFVSQGQRQRSHRSGGFCQMDGRSDHSPVGYRTALELHDGMWCSQHPRPRKAWDE